LTNDNTVTQNTETTNPSAGGKATYRFAVPNSGNYAVMALVKAPSTTYNSFFGNIDAEPISPHHVWDIELVGESFTNQYVSWRGNGTVENPQFNPKYFYLLAGEHNLIFRGREAKVELSKISLVRAEEESQGVESGSSA